ncbi:MAG: tetratricopeptide repeat protein [Prevotella sp.]|nr:tetratricopeptide repeat protein [Prevotella sp.]
MRRFLASLAWLVLLVLLASPASAQTPQEWRDSVSTLIEAIRQNPNSTDLRLKKAEANINLQQWEYAIEEYGDVLRLDDRNLAALYFRAYCHSQLRHYDMAKADYDAFLVIQPQHFEAHLGRAHVLQKMGRMADVLDELNLIVQQFPDSADAYAARAAYETEQKLYDVALYDWDEAIRLRPSVADYYVSKADVLLGLGRKKDARETLDTLVLQGTPRGALKEWYDRCK